MLKSIRFFTFVLVYLNLLFYSYSLETKNSFIWCDNFILGGSFNGKWIDSKDVFSKIKKGDKFKLYNLNGFIQTVYADKPYLDEQCESPSLDMNGYSFDVPASESFVAVNSNWNEQPRKAVTLSNDIPVYKECAKQILAYNKIYTSSPSISQVFKIDLEGDGIDEVVITLNNIVFEDSNLSAKKGDYSAVILRKIVNGKVKNILVEGTFYDHIEKRADGFEHSFIFTHKVFNFLDLNGDGIMEIITGNREFEGFGVSVYEIKNGKSTQVLDNGWGV